jgi:hypothetical protein
MLSPVPSWAGGAPLGAAFDAPGAWRPATGGRAGNLRGHILAHAARKSRTLPHLPNRRSPRAPVTARKSSDIICKRLRERQGGGRPLPSGGGIRKREPGGGGAGLREGTEWGSGRSGVPKAGPFWLVVAGRLGGGKGLDSGVPAQERGEATVPGADDGCLIARNSLREPFGRRSGGERGESPAGSGA